MKLLNQNLSPQANEDSDCRQGHKWTLASLWQYFAESGIDSAPVIESIKDLVIKTIISAESSMYTVSFKQRCYFKLELISNTPNILPHI